MYALALGGCAAQACPGVLVCVIGHCDDMMTRCHVTMKLPNDASLGKLPYMTVWEDALVLKGQYCLFSSKS